MAGKEGCWNNQPLLLQTPVCMCLHPTLVLNCIDMIQIEQLPCRAKMHQTALPHGAVDVSVWDF